EDRAPRHPRVARHIVAAHAVVGDHLALEIADQIEGQPAQLLGEGLVREDRIHADAVDADTVGNRVFVPGPKLGQLGPSTTREIEDIEKEDDGTVLLQGVGERELLAAGRRQLEFGRFVPYLQHGRKVYGVLDSSTYH